MDYIIIQAGGEGTRMGGLTANKPKALVPFNGLPLIFHLFRQYPDARFIVIGDYLFDVLREYLHAFAKVRYLLVKAGGHGTCAGLRDALLHVPAGTPFMYIWSDLVLDPGFHKSPLDMRHNYVGIAEGFTCRWSYESGRFTETPSKGHGVAGLFAFKGRDELRDVPGCGEFVRWLGSSGIRFEELPLGGTEEVGTLGAYQGLEPQGHRCRPFNKLRFAGDMVIKEPTDAQGELLARRERRWYEKAAALGFKHMPEVVPGAAVGAPNALVLSRVKGRNIYSMDLAPAQKTKLLDNIIGTLLGLHGLEAAPADPFSIQECYYNKTMARLAPARDLVPFAGQPRITVNGRSCRNIFHHRAQVQEKVKGMLHGSQFAFIHGDCTFSNIMAGESLQPTLLDPRGYFGHTELHGDVQYDWAKLYYSLYGDYDQFNNRKFRLEIEGRDGGGEPRVALTVQSNGWRGWAGYFMRGVPGLDEGRVKLIHALVWLSLSTYAWEDYDSVCGAFYNGLYYLEEVL